MVLIAKGTNKSIQDKPFQLKKLYYSPSGFFPGSLSKEAYVHETGFKAFITKNGFDFKPYEEFGVDQVLERTELVAKIAEHIWSRDRIIEIE